MSNYGAENFLRSLRPGDPSIFLFGIPSTVALAASPNGASRTNNVVTFTTLGAVAHNFAPGMLLTAQGVGSVGGTQFGGLYLILTVPSASTLTAQPLQQGPSGTPSSPGNQNQVNDTGGGGSMSSIAAEQPAAPQQSIAVALADADAHNNDNLSLEIFFTGAPGAFEVDLMEADTNIAIDYQIGSGGVAKLTVVSANNTGRIDATNIVAKFVTCNLASRTNAVGIIAKLSR